MSVRHLLYLNVIKPQWLISHSPPTVTSSWTEELSEKIEGYRQISVCVVFIMRDGSSWASQTEIPCSPTIQWKYRPFHRSI